MRLNYLHRKTAPQSAQYKLIINYYLLVLANYFSLTCVLVVFQFQLFSTWGDPYYIGLNGLEFYDENGYRIRLTENNITAYPHSVNVLEGVTDDIRTPDKLIDGVNDTTDGRHMWLAPILPGMVRVSLTRKYLSGR